MEMELREMNYVQLNSRLAKWGKPTAFHRSAWNMYKGDMWDGGLGYIGPAPALEDPNKDRVLSLISRAFTSRNVVKECIDRAVDGLISRSPNWKVYNQDELLSRAVQESQKRADIAKRSATAENNIDKIANQDDPKFVKREENKDLPPAVSATNDNGTIKVQRVKVEGSQDQSEIVNKKEIEADILLGKLWTDLNLKEVIMQALAERLTTGRGCARIYVPKKYISDDGSIKTMSGLLEATKAVRAERIPREEAKIVDDEGYRISVVKLEKSTVADSKIRKSKGVEVSFVDDDGLTYLAVFEQGTKSKSKKNKEVPPAGIQNSNIEDVSETIKELKEKADVGLGVWLDENLLTEELCGTPLVTEQLLQNNRALNLDLTLGVNVLIEDGFTEMLTTNAAMQTKEVPDPDNPGKMKKIPANLQRGTSVVNNLVGVQTYDDKGTKIYQQPGVIFREPTTLATFNMGEQLYYRQCLAEVKQIFVLISADSLASGESRIQARQDFLNEILRFKADVDKFGGWMLSTLLHLVAAIAGKPGYFKGIGVTFDSRVTAGELSADEKNVVISRYEKHLISKENALVLLGTEDPILEIDAIRADIAEQMEDNVRRVSAMSQFSQEIQADKEANPKSDKQPERVKKGQPSKK